MDPSQFALLRGEWSGIGKMTMGSLTGDVVEYVRMEATESPEILSYVRKSRIVFPGRVAVHNELGFVRVKSVGLMLHRGTYNILEWDEQAQHYAMVAGSADTRQMIRKITFSDPTAMHWYNFMEVQHGGSWVSHEVETDFTSLIIKSAHDKTPLDFFL
jgi:hypothetical protein